MELGYHCKVHKGWAALRISPNLPIMIFVRNCVYIPIHFVYFTYHGNTFVAYSIVS